MRCRAGPPTPPSGRWPPSCWRRGRSSLSSGTGWPDNSRSRAADLHDQPAGHHGPAGGQFAPQSNRPRAHPAGHEPTQVIGLDDYHAVPVVDLNHAMPPAGYLADEPPGAGRRHGVVEVDHRDGVVVVQPDDLGRFVASGVSAGPVRLRCELPTGGSVMTSWLAVTVNGAGPT